MNLIKKSRINYHALDNFNNFQIYNQKINNKFEKLPKKIINLIHNFAVYNSYTKRIVIIIENIGKINNIQ
jgi:hypothetical protein